MGDNIFRILEIEPTSDKKEIKKAYARLVKRYHPEEYPEEWKRIHDAYEIALKSVEQAANEQTEYMAQNVLTDERRKKKAPVLERKLILEGKSDMPQQDKDEEEINVLFQDIGQLSKEQKEQEEETQKKALESMKKEMRQMCTKKQLEQREWESFFRREDMLPLFCTDEFLHEFGECFTNRKIDRKLYHFLTEQLLVIEQYRNNRNIANKSTIWDPIEVTRVKIYSAYTEKRTVHDMLKGMTAAAKALAWIVIVVLGVVGMYLRLTRISRLGEQNREQISYMQEYMENQQEYERRSEEMREFIEKSIAAEIVEIGDTREKMISLYGEPDIIQPYPDNPEYEEAVYHQSVTDLKIVLDEDVVVYLYYDSAESE